MAYTTPWVFNQHKLPGDPSELEDKKIALRYIKKFEPRFISSFESVIKFYSENDLESLEKCLEPQLFNIVKENLTNLKNNNIELRMLNKEQFNVIPLSFEVNFFIGKNRSLNPKITFSSIPKKTSDYFLIDLLIKFVSSKDVYIFLEAFNFYLSIPLKKTLVVSIEVGFYGKPPLVIFEDEKQLNNEKNLNEYHTVKFEGEVGLFNLFSDSNLSLNEDITWSICDIDNLLNGNELLRPEVLD